MRGPARWFRFRLAGRPLVEVGFRGAGGLSRDMDRGVAGANQLGTVAPGVIAAQGSATVHFGANLEPRGTANFFRSRLVGRDLRCGPSSGLRLAPSLGSTCGAPGGLCRSVGRGRFLVRMGCGLGGVPMERGVASRLRARSLAVGVCRGHRDAVRQNGQRRQRNRNDCGPAHEGWCGQSRASSVYAGPDGVPSTYPDANLSDK